MLTLPEVNLINVLRAAFGVQRSQKCKKDWQLVNLFALWGSARVKAARVKAARRMWMKLTPEVNFIIIF